MKRALLLPLLLMLTAAVFAEPGYPVTIKDAWGTELTLAAKPKAILSLTLTTDELLFDLVELSRLLALEGFATDPGISNIADKAALVPGRITADKEKILALSPDLVLVADWKEKEFVQSLRDAKVPVFVFRSPNSFADLKTAVTQIAALVGEPARGKALLDKVDARLAAVAARTKTWTTKPTVLSYSFEGSTYGRGTSFDALVTAAGLVNAASQAGLEGWPQLSKEQVLAFDPDVIVLPSWSWDGKDDPQKFLAAFEADPAFAGLTAVRTHHVVILPDKHLQATSQYMADGVEDLARAARP
jgi:iron complex transport system substrate-binding protein